MTSIIISPVKGGYDFYLIPLNGESGPEADKSFRTPDINNLSLNYYSGTISTP